MHARAGQPAQPEDLIDVDEVVSAYYDLVPDPSVPTQKVVFGTSGHRGSSLDTAFNEAHIVATTAAIVEYRRTQGTDGTLSLGRDTHALSEPAWRTAVEVLAGAGVTTAALCAIMALGLAPQPGHAQQANTAPPLLRLVGGIRAAPRRMVL
ncbi:MAG: hypothetical protein ACFNLH_02600, partial [Corynebacterium matruchotii]